MPKIPTFTAEGSVTQLQGTTSNIQMGLNQNLATALAPVTKMVVDQKVKENALQNQAEALRLENDFITDMQDVQKTIKTAKDSNGVSLYATNKKAANKYLKEQSEFFIKKYRALATNGNVQDKFSNYALAETQKSIFETDKIVSKQIILSLNNDYDKAKKNLLLTAYADGGIHKETLELDLQKLTIDTYSSQLSPPELDKMLSLIPVQIQLFDGIRDVNNFPKKTLQLLKNKKYLPNLSVDQRIDLEEKAKNILRPQITKEFENYVKARELGKEPPRFDFEFVKEVMTIPQAEKIMIAKTVVDDNADDIKIFHSVSNEDINIQLQRMKEDNNNKYSLDIAIHSNNFLENAARNIISNREDDPVKYLLETDTNIENQSIELANMESDGAAFVAPNQYDGSAINQAQEELTEKLIQKQKDLGIKNIKVMTNEQSKSFVASYNEAAQLSDGDKLNNMVNGLLDSYGDNAGISIQQLRENGLPFGALVSAGLKNSVLAEIALSFDTKEEKKEIQKFLKNSKINKNEMQEEIKNGIADFINIVRKNTPNDSSDSLTKTNEIEEFLTFVAAQKMNGNPDMSESDAIQFAVDSWNNNFVLTDTYYIGKQQDDKVLNLNETNRIQDTTDLLKTYYLDELDVVAFQSNFEDDPVKLSNKMRSQMSINGEWRNTPDGEGVIFGIVLDNGFAPVINNKGEQIIFKFNDNSNLVPGTDIIIDFDVGFNEPEKNTATSIIDTFEKANKLAREEGITYEEALKKIRKPNISNIEFDNKKIKDDENVPLNDPFVLKDDENVPLNDPFANNDNID